jgi:hypothetical protein
MTTFLLFFGLLALTGSLLFLFVPGLAPGASKERKRLGLDEESENTRQDEPGDLDDREEIDYLHETTSYTFLEDRSWLDDRRDQTLAHAKSLLVELMEHAREHSMQPSVPAKSLPELAAIQVGKTVYTLKSWLLSRTEHALALELEIQSSDLARQVWITGPPNLAQQSAKNKGVDPPAKLGDPLLDRLFSITGMHELTLMLPKQREALCALFATPPVKIDIWPGHARLRWHVRDRRDFPDIHGVVHALTRLENLKEPDLDELRLLLESATRSRARARLIDAMLDLDGLSDPEVASGVLDELAQHGDVDLLITRTISRQDEDKLDESVRRDMLLWGLARSKNARVREVAVQELDDALDGFPHALAHGLEAGSEAARLINLAALLKRPKDEDEERWWLLHVTLARLIGGEFAPLFNTASRSASELVQKDADHWYAIVRASSHALLDHCVANHEELSQDTWEARSIFCVIELCARANIQDTRVFLQICELVTSTSHNETELLLAYLVTEALRDTQKLELLSKFLARVNIKALPHAVLQLKEHPEISERSRADILLAVLKRAPDIFKQTAAAKRLIAEIESSPWEIDILRQVAEGTAPMHRALAVQALARRSPDKESMLLFAKLLSEASLSADSLDAATEILRVWEDFEELEQEHLELMKLFEVYPKMVCLEVVLNRPGPASVALIEALLPDPERGLTIGPTAFNKLWNMLLDHTRKHREYYGEASFEGLLIAIAHKARWQTRREVLETLFPIGTLSTLALVHQLLRRNDLSEETRKLINARIPELEARVGKDAVGALSLSTSRGEGELTIVEHGEGRLTMLEPPREEP